MVHFYSAFWCTFKSPLTAQATYSGGMLFLVEDAPKVNSKSPVLPGINI